ncbi:hypothetical protein BJ085DRAFT_32336 [Dimargaris cristalligena]|uniref:Uncharacterized protein n=1 Tax=Dimargaris cristalligena TaxID=215637 RepID=A0A4P9ZUG4_9FUNG|nr:hypothetical protein BJ085DRAFT_32336 [Dimargaris cristalligena]|eukprot:RKP36521.1 hypothetical protein BJ085DRAFT_32336 [Dimargaris cristalligena]
MSVAKLSGGVIAVTCLLSLAGSIAATGQHSTNQAQASTEQKLYQIGDYIPEKGIISWAQSPGDLHKPPLVDQTSDQVYPYTKVGQAPHPPPFTTHQAWDFMTSTGYNQQVNEPGTTHGGEGGSVTTSQDPPAGLENIPHSIYGTFSGHWDTEFSSQYYPTNPGVSTGFGESDFTYPYNGLGTVDDRASEQLHPITSSGGPNLYQKNNKNHPGTSGWTPYVHPTTPKPVDSLVKGDIIDICTEKSEVAFSRGYPDYARGNTGKKILKILRKFMGFQSLFGLKNSSQPKINIEKLSRFIKQNLSKTVSPSLIYAIEWNAELRTIVPYFFTVRLSTMPIFGTPDEMEKAFEEAIETLMSEKSLLISILLVLQYRSSNASALVPIAHYQTTTSMVYLLNMGAFSIQQL